MARRRGLSKAFARSVAERATRYGHKREGEDEVSATCPRCRASISARPNYSEHGTAALRRAIAEHVWDGKLSDCNEVLGFDCYDRFAGLPADV